MKSKRFVKLFHRKIILAQWAKFFVAFIILTFFSYCSINAFMQPSGYSSSALRKNKAKAEKEVYEWEQKMKEMNK
jgi:hypothetical protein